MLGLAVPWEGFTSYPRHCFPALSKLGYSFLVSASLNKAREDKQFIGKNESVRPTVAWSKV